jgi:hypothetical protein
MHLGYWVHGRTWRVWIILAALAVLSFSIAMLFFFFEQTHKPFGIDELQGLLD